MKNLIWRLFAAADGDIGDDKANNEIDHITKTGT